MRNPFRKSVIVGVGLFLAAAGALLYQLQRQGWRSESAQPRALSSPLAPGGTAVAAASMPASVAAIRPTNQAGFWKRLEAVHQLSRSLSTEEIQAVYRLLASTEFPTQPKALGGERVLRNDLLNALHQQLRAPADLDHLLAHIYRNPSQDPVMRDYALQHLVTWAEQTLLHHPYQWSKRRGEVFTILQEALSETDSSNAGTALLGLQHLSGIDPEQTAASLPRGLNDIALGLLQADSSSDLVRIAALQVCAERGIRAALPIARTLANAGASTPLQVAALGTLGKVGTPSDLPVLDQLSGIENSVIRRAAQVAKQRLSQANPQG